MKSLVALSASSTIVTSELSSTWAPFGSRSNRRSHDLRLQRDVGDALCRSIVHLARNLAAHLLLRGQYLVRGGAPMCGCRRRASRTGCGWRLTRRRFTVVVSDPTTRQQITLEATQNRHRLCKPVAIALQGALFALQHLDLRLHHQSRLVWLRSTPRASETASTGACWSRLERAAHAPPPARGVTSCRCRLDLRL